MKGIEVVGLTGLTRSGKDEAANELVRGYGFAKLAYADALKAGCAAMTGQPLEKFYEGDRSGLIPGLNYSYREFLQLVGTEAMRQTFGEDIWVDLLRMRMQALVSKGFQRFVISDVRFDNEARFIRSLKGPVVRIHRPGIPQGTHASEQGVSRRLITAVIDNDRSLKVFRARVSQWAEERWG